MKLCSIENIHITNPKNIVNEHLYFSDAYLS